MVETALAVRIDLRSGTWRGWTGEADENLPIMEVLPTGASLGAVNNVYTSTSQRILFAVTQGQRSLMIITDVPTYGTDSYALRVNPRTGVGEQSIVAGNFGLPSDSTNPLVTLFFYLGRFYRLRRDFRSRTNFRIDHYPSGDVPGAAGTVLPNTPFSIPRTNGRDNPPFHCMVEANNALYAIGENGEVWSVNPTTLAFSVVAVTTGRRIMHCARVFGESNAVYVMSDTDSPTSKVFGKITIDGTTTASYRELETLTIPAESNGAISMGFVTNSAYLWANRGYAPITVQEPMQTTATYPANSGLVSIDLPSTDIDGPGSFRIGIAVPEAEKHRWVASQGPIAVIVRQLIRDSVTGTWRLMPHEWHGVLGEGAYNDGLFTTTATPESGTPRRQMKPVRWNHDAQNRRTDGVDTSLAFQRATAVPIRMPSRIARPR